jgi:hypothetical protein
MDPQAVTAGARLGRRLRPIVILAMQKSPDPTCLAGGMLSTIVGTIAGLLGPGTAAELIRINLERLEQKGGRLLLPPGVREAFDSAAANDEPPAPTGELLEPPSEAYVLRLLGRIGELEGQLRSPAIAEVLGAVNNDQLEAMRRVLSVVSAKAGIESDKLVELLDIAIEEVRSGRPPAPIGAS